MNRIPLLVATAAASLLSFGGHTGGDRPVPPPAFITAPSPWADSVFATLDLKDRIAQLMMVPAWSNKGEKHESEVDRLIRQQNIGGLIFFQGGPVRQARLTNHFQDIARTPLLIGMDLEWGLAMRLDSTMRFPKQMTLGALQDDSPIQAMGAEIARQMQRLGVQVSFSPVADVNNNPANPVINDRSFGEDRELVARKAIAYMRGLQSGGVIATAKHFPGHGDTDTDSHFGLPLLAQTRARLDSMELYPFERLVQEGLSAMMVGHLEVPALDSVKGTPSTLSRPTVNGLLQREIGFGGLVFTDALNMKGVANADKPGEIELRALEAGNDVLLFPQDPVKAIERIKQAVDSGEVPREMIDHKCLKVLRAKEWAGLFKHPHVTEENLVADLNTSDAKWLRRSLYQDAITLLRNDGVLPINKLDKLRIASLVIGDSLHNTFQAALERYAPIDEFRCDKVMKPDSMTLMLNKLKGYDLVIVSVHGTTFRVDKEFGVPQITLDLMRRLGDQNKMAFVNFANPYRLTTAYGAQRWNAVIEAYEENDDTQDLAAQLLFGAIEPKGKLPVTASSFFAKGDGLSLPKAGRLSYTLPEADGVASADLSRIDGIMAEAMAAGAFPGGQVLVAQGDQVIYQKAFGYLDPEHTRPARTDDIYDLASVTKVAGTTLAVMRLVDEHKIDLNGTLGDHMPELIKEHSQHAALRIRDILTHQAGLVPFVPFYKKLLKDGKLDQRVVRDTADATHPLRVADRIYLPAAYRDSVIKWMFEAPLKPRGEYVYSDFSMYLMMLLVEHITGTTLDRYLDSTFYKPLGLSTMGYRPLTRFAKDRIAPTEYDRECRQQLVRGDVHDPGAAMLGGVGGHAGLFSDANDLAVIMRMLLNGGTYGGKRYLSDTTIAEFTKCQFCARSGPAAGSENRRGLGWDKPQPAGKPGPACDCVSYLSFGHTGFTGTEVWADPLDGTVYIFLSNRVCPDANNKKLSDLNVRTKVQEVIHAAVARRALPLPRK